jgi:hypothetical protein
VPTKPIRPTATAGATWPVTTVLRAQVRPRRDRYELAPPAPSCYRLEQPVVMDTLSQIDTVCHSRMMSGSVFAACHAHSTGTSRAVQQPVRHECAAARDGLPYPLGVPRYERLVFDADGQLVVPLNEWYRLMEGVGAARTRDTYLAVLRP